MVDVCARLGIAAVLVFAAACSRQIDEAEARQRAFGYAIGELSMVEPHNQDVRIVDKAKSFEITYAPKSAKAFGGPVTIEVNKRTGEPKLLVMRT